MGSHFNFKKNRDTNSINNLPRHAWNYTLKLPFNIASHSLGTIMAFSQESKQNPSFPQHQISTVEAGRQCQGKLWSNLKDLCDLLNIAIVPPITKEELLFQHIQFKAGQRIHTIGQTFEALYIVHSGFLKTVLINEFGNEQVLNFPMKGDLLGIDGIHTKRYTSEVVALSDCDLILLPFRKLIALGRTHIELEFTMYDVMSRELAREQAMVGMLGALSAEARVARFLVSLSERFALMGYSSKLFNLRMTRQEIGSYLGLTLETVSRTLSAFNELGFICVNQRAIEIKDINELKGLHRLPSPKSLSKQLLPKVSKIPRRRPYSTPSPTESINSRI